VLVEGNFDVISLHQAGISETVAPLGTALNIEQVDQLRRLAHRVVLLFDADSAGQAAAIKALQTLVARDVEVLVAQLPSGEDPDSYVRKFGEKALTKQLDSASPAVEFFIHEVWKRAAHSADGHAEAVRQAAQVIKSIADATKQDFIIGTFAAALNTDETRLRRALRRALTHQNHDEPIAFPTDRPPSNPSKNNKVPRYELDIIAILADHPGLVSVAEKRGVFSLLTDGSLRDMYSALQQGSPVLGVSGADRSIVEHLLAGSFAQVENPAQTLEGMIKHLERVRQRAKLHHAPDDQQDLEQERKRLREIVTTRRQID